MGLGVGISDPDALEHSIVRKRESGVSLSVLGFGTGNYNIADRPRPRPGPVRW